MAGFAFRGAIQDEPPGTVRVVTMAGVGGNTLTAELDLPSIAFNGDLTKLQVRPDDLIFRSRGINNQVIAVESVAQPAILAAPLVRIRIHDTHKVAPRYLHWLLNSAPMQRIIDGIARGSMVRMVSVSGLRDLRIPLPSIGVQRQIAAVASLQKQEEEISSVLIAKRQTLAEQVLWAKAQEVR